ncbi:MAG: hypothetical protein IJT70_02255 [Clostridia bacterium]|nr:hypothetical protein [Clostridia bacterium]
MEAIFDKIRRKKKRELAQKNFENNSKLDSDRATTTEGRLVCDQNGTTGDLFVYGDYPARRNACEAIAVHNALTLLGKRSCLSEVIVRFQILRVMVFRGFFGSNVFRIGRALKYYGVTYKRFFRKKKTGEPGIYILSYWNEHPLKYGLHTVAMKYDGKEYSTYNLRGSGVCADDPKKFAKRFIVGYRAYRESEAGGKIGEEEND